MTPPCVGGRVTRWWVSCGRSWLRDSSRSGRRRTPGRGPSCQPHATSLAARSSTRSCQASSLKSVMTWLKSNTGRLCVCGTVWYCLLGGSFMYVCWVGHLCMCVGWVTCVCVLGGSLVYVCWVGHLCMCVGWVTCVCVLGGSLMYVCRVGLPRTVDSVRFLSCYNCQHFESQMSVCQLTVQCSTARHITDLTCNDAVYFQIVR